MGLGFKVRVGLFGDYTKGIQTGLLKSVRLSTSFRTLRRHPLAPFYEPPHEPAFLAGTPFEAWTA